MTDIEGSTKMWEAHPDAMERALRRHDSLLERLVAEHCGMVVKHTGDGLFAVFVSGQPLVCAAEIQRKMASLDWGETGPVRLRVALHAGPSRARRGDYFGPEVSRTARLMEAAWGGQTLLTAAALERCGIPEGLEVRDLGSHMLRDLGAPVRILGLFGPGLQVDFPPLRTLSSRPNNLPEQSTPFVGRKRELNRLKKMLGSPEHRLVTVMGMGGMGKTRLAIQAASDLLDDFPDGVFLVYLEALEDPHEIPSAIASAIGLRRSGKQGVEAELSSFLSSRSILLVLDNFEHLLDGAPGIARLFSDAPGLRVLATSRASLGLSTETVLRLEGLGLPEDPMLDPESAESVQLFVQHLERHVPQATVSSDALAGIVGICRLLGGTPLAIELAASWTGVLRPGDILQRLQKGLELLAEGPSDVPARHKSIEKVFEYSWNLLEEEERKLLAALSIFSGSFTFDAAEKVTEGALSHLRSLQDKSLLSSPAAGRLQLHPLIADQVLQRAREGEVDLKSLEEAHMRHYLTRIDPSTWNLRNRLSPRALKELTDDLPDIRKAWKRGVATGRGRELALGAAGLKVLFAILGMYESGVELLRGAAESLCDSKPEAVAMIELAVGQLELRTARYEVAIRHLDIALGTLSEGADAQALVEAYVAKASALKRLGKLEAAREWFQKAMEPLEAAHSTELRATALLGLGDLANHEHDYSKAVKLCREARELFREIGDPMGAVNCSITLSNIHCRQDSNLDALKEAEEALLDAEGSVMREKLALSLLCKADACLKLGRNEEALEAALMSKELFSDLGDRWGLQISLPSLAHAMMRCGDRQGCHKPIRELEMLCRDIGPNYNSLEVLLQAAWILCEARDLDEALRVSGDALAIARKLDNDWMLCTTLTATAELHLACEETERAAGACRESLELLANLADGEMGARVMEVCFQLFTARKSRRKALLTGEWLVQESGCELSDPEMIHGNLEQARSAAPEMAEELSRRAASLSAAELAELLLQSWR